jgi:hypothetical protein
MPGTDRHTRRVLLLYLVPQPRAARATVLQHVEALTRLPGTSEVLAYNAVHGAPPWLRHVGFDAVVLHTTFLCMRWNIWFEHWKRRSEWLADLDCLKIAFPQDEYDHAGVLDDWLDELGVSVVCTVLDDTHRAELYPKLSTRGTFYEVLTGYVDDASAERFRTRMLPAADRPYDLVYRARHPPYWFGSHSQLKHRIGEAVVERAPAHGLTTDISTRMHETVLGDAWLDFLGTGRATIGTESGTSVIDPRGEIGARMRELLHREPELTFEEASARMPAGWDDYRFFALSPRHLEAAATQTAQILVEGRYSGVLEPERHYLPVRRDFADLDDVLERARDRALLERLARQAYADVYASGRYSSRTLSATLQRILDEHAGRRVRGGALSGPQAFPVVRQVAGAASDVERVVVAPVANVLRVGRTGAREMLAGLRLVATDPDSGRLLLDYLRSAETRAYVSPREALADLLLVGSYRRARAGKHDGPQPFAVSTELDEERRRVVLRAHRVGTGVGNGAATTPEQLDELLRLSAWDFLLDHSEVGDEVECRLAGSRTLSVPVPAGPRPLKTLNWLARYRPRDVAAVLGPILR